MMADPANTNYDTALEHAMRQRFKLAHQVGYLTGVIKVACADLAAGDNPMKVADRMRRALAEIEAKP